MRNDAVHADKQYPYDPHTVAKKDGREVLAVCDLPNDPHLQVTLCRWGEGDDTEFVCWFFNKESGGFGEGLYSKCPFRAALDYVLRATRYGGKPSTYDLDYAKLKAVAKQLFPHEK